MTSKSTKPRASRQLTLAITQCDFTRDVAANTIRETPVIVRDHLVLHATVLSPAHAADRKDFYVNLVTKPGQPRDPLTGRSIGNVLFTSEFNKAFLFAEPEEAWQIFLAVKSDAITHLMLALEPANDAEDVVVAYALAAQPEGDLFLQQFEPED